MRTADQVHRTAPLIVPDVAATARPATRKRRARGDTPQATALRAEGSVGGGAPTDGSPIIESRTMAPDGALGLAPPATRVVPTFPTVPPSSPPSSSRGRRTDSAAG